MQETLTRPGKTSKRLNIRVDSSLRIGSGHVTRCIAIAEEAVLFGHDVRFLFRDLEGSQTRRMVSQHFDCLAIPGEAHFEQQLETIESLWPDVEQARDAGTVQRILADHENEVLLVDHYGLGKGFSSYLREAWGSTELYFIHDFKTPNCTSSCIHPGVTSPVELALRIEEEKEGTQFFFNQSMVPLSKAVRTSKKQEDSNELRDRRIELRIFVDFGTSEVENFIEMIYSAIQEVAKEFPVTVTALQPHVRRQTSYPNRSEDSFPQSPSYVKFESQSSYLEFMQSQDLVIGAGGVSCLERLYLGIPQIVFSISDNQIELAKSLSAWNTIHSGGTLNKILSIELSDYFKRALKNLDLLAQNAKNGQLQIDGYGAQRIAHLLLGNQSEELTLREVRSDDASLLFGWGNDPQLRRNSLSHCVIDPQEHLNWFEEKLHSPDQVIYILQLGSAPIGQVRFTREFGKKFALSYSIDSVYRGSGLAKKLLTLSIAAHRAAFPEGVYQATIRTDNPASRAALVGIGFTVSKYEDNFEHLLLH